MSAVMTGNATAERQKGLNSVESEWKQRIFTRLLQVLDLTLITSVEESQAREQIREATKRLLIEESAPLSLAQRQQIIRQIEDEVLGHGPLEPLLADPAVADILVNGPDQVFIEKRGKLQLTDIRFHDNAHLLNIIDRIVSAVGRRVDESSPMVDARLKDGSRVNVIIPPLALDGPVMSIRRFSVVPLELGHLSIGKNKQTFEDDLGALGLHRLGRKKWQKCVERATERFVSALLLDDVVLGGGDAKKLSTLPQGCRMGDNANAFLGGFRLWERARK